MAFFFIYYGFSGRTDNHILWLAFLVYLFLRGVMQTVWGQAIFTVKYLQTVKNKAFPEGKISDQQM